MPSVEAVKCTICGADSFMFYRKFYIVPGSYIRGRWIYAVCDVCKKKQEDLEERVLTETMDGIHRYGGD